MKILIFLNNSKSIDPRTLIVCFVPTKPTIPVILHLMWSTLVLKQTIVQLTTN